MINYPEEQVWSHVKKLTGKIKGPPVYCQEKKSKKLNRGTLRPRKLFFQTQIGRIVIGKIFIISLF